MVNLRMIPMKNYYVLVKRFYKGEIETLHIRHHNGTMIMKKLREKGFLVLQARPLPFYLHVKRKYKDHHEYWEKHKRYKTEYDYIKYEMDLELEQEFIDLEGVEKNG